MTESWKLTGPIDRVFLKQNGYPVPQDCPKEKCNEYRPACSLNICKIAICLCGDW